jgi:hypothetical protein
MLIVSMGGLYFDTQESELELVGYMRPTKAPRKNKNLRCIMDFVHLSSMATSYNHHFMLYNQDKNNATQLIPSQVWKVVYKDYKKQFPYSEFHPKSLKDRLRECLKELNIGT